MKNKPIAISLYDADGYILSSKLTENPTLSHPNAVGYVEGFYDPLTKMVVDGVVVDRVDAPSVFDSTKRRYPPVQRQLDLIWKALQELKTHPFSEEIEMMIEQMAKASSTIPP